MVEPTHTRAHKREDTQPSLGRPHFEESVFTFFGKRQHRGGKDDNKRHDISRGTRGWRCPRHLCQRLNPATCEQGRQGRWRSSCCCGHLRASETTILPVCATLGPLSSTPGARLRALPGRKSFGIPPTTCTRDGSLTAYVLQCIGSHPCLRCIEASERCSYKTCPPGEDEYAGKDFSEISDLLELLRDDGSVPLAMKVAFTLLWCVSHER